MGVKYNCNIRTSTSRKNEGHQIPPGMTPIVCRNCGRTLGAAYSTDSVVICDKCGYRFYIRIGGEVEVNMPVHKLDYEGYYKETDIYMKQIETVSSGEQKLLKSICSEAV